MSFRENFGDFNSIQNRGKAKELWCRFDSVLLDIIR